MKVQDAIAEDKRRKGFGIARHTSGQLYNVRLDGNNLVQADSASPEPMKVSLWSIPLYASDDWEPVTPEPVCEPAPEWVEIEIEVPVSCREDTTHIVSARMRPLPKGGEA